MATYPFVSFSTEPARDRVLLRVHGELELTTTPLLRRELEELIDLGWRRIVVDLDAVGFLDVGAVRTLVHAARRVAADGGVLSIAGAHDEIAGALRFAGDELSQVSPAPVEGIGAA